MMEKRRVEVFTAGCPVCIDGRPIIWHSVFAFREVK